MKQSTHTHAPVWLVTGASSGLGYAMVEAAARQGYRVVATARTLAPLQPLVDRWPDQVMALRLDIRDQGQIAQCIKDATSRFGRIDTLVNNASFGHFGAIEEVADDAARAQFDTNFFGALSLIRTLLPHFRAKGAGRILNISSISAHAGFGGLALYAASKAAIEGLSVVLAHEVRPFGVKVSVVVPGALDTRFAPNMQMADPLPSYDPLRAEWAAWKGLQQFSDLEKTADAIVEIGTLEAPPLIVPLGADSLTLMQQEYQRNLDLCHAWSTLALSPSIKGAGAEHVADLTIERVA